MKLATSIVELSDIRDELAIQQPRPIVAFVPTMGALHAGHMSLFRIARNVADIVVVSIFVNPLQFGPDEDYARYPRTLDQDLEACRAEGVDVVFVPSVAELYPAGRQVTVNAGHLGTVLEGRSRPGHFDGVLTVVSKLLNIVQPQKAIFGQKDAQQLVMVRKMAVDLNCDVDIVAAPIIREDDGLALSTRNRYLLPHERKSALSIPGALRAGSRQHTVTQILDAAHSVAELAETDGSFRLDYLALVHPQTFVELGDDYEGPALLVMAAWVGETRLIDNLDVSLVSPTAHDDETAELLRAAERVSL